MNQLTNDRYDHFHGHPSSLPKFSKYLVRMCLDPLKAFSKHLHTSYLEHHSILRRSLNHRSIGLESSNPTIPSFRRGFHGRRYKIPLLECDPGLKGFTLFLSLYIYTYIIFIYHRICQNMCIYIYVI